MLQSVVAGKSAEVCTALGVAECLDHEHVESVILRAYELVPEAYRPM